MMTTYLSPFAILGAGSWGTALALHLSRLKQPVRLWSFETPHALEMQKESINKRYFPEHPFPKTLTPVVSLADALENMPDILIAVPSMGFRDLLIQLKPHLPSAARILWVSKGFDEKAGELLHDVAHAILGKEHSYAVLSGPSFASEVAKGLPTAVVIASQDLNFAQDLAQRFASPFFRVYISNDMTGVETGGAVKNVIAIATGLSDGMGYGTNARCALITRGLAEMTRLGVALGAQYETFTGLTGLGDLVLTCTDDQSRNRRFGLSIGKGLSIDEAAHEIGQVIEGRRNTDLIMQLAKRMHVDMPITEAVWKILNHAITPNDAMRLLFSRSMKSE